MRVLVSTLYSSPGAAHGGPIAARRHADALALQGMDVTLAAPEPPVGGNSTPVRIVGYEASTLSNNNLSTRRPDQVAAASLRDLVCRLEPDILYDVHGPAWAVAAAAKVGIPVVSLVGSYTWFCAQAFLVNSRLERCPGPESLAKCFECMNARHPRKRRVVQEILRRARIAGIPPRWPPIPRLSPYRIWEDLEEFTSFVAELRDLVACFVISDDQARSFFLAHGVPPEKVAMIPQGLPAIARINRRVERHAGPFGPKAPLKVGYVGRLAVEKGFQVLVRAFEELPPDSPIELWVIHVHEAVPENVGRWFCDQPRFRDFLRQGRVRLMRPDTSDELHGLMARVDLGIIPSIAYESPSLAMMEFVAQGTPILRSVSSAMNHVIQDGVNGRTFPYGDWGALRGLLMEILESPGLIEDWRSRLPVMEDDSRFATSLVALFERLIAKRRVAAD